MSWPALMPVDQSANRESMAQIVHPRMHVAVIPHPKPVTSFLNVSFTVLDFSEVPASETKRSPIAIVDAIHHDVGCRSAAS